MGDLQMESILFLVHIFLFYTSNNYGTDPNLERLAFFYVSILIYRVTILLGNKLPLT